MAKIKVSKESKENIEIFKENLNSCLKLFVVTHLEVVLVVDISWKLEAFTMKNRGEN